MKWQLVNKEITENYGVELLKERGIKDITSFLTPTENMIQSPWDLENVQAGIDLIKETAAYEFKILLLPDSDADGMTSAAILFGYLKDLYKDNLDSVVDIDYWLHEGKQHGLEDHIDRIEEGFHKAQQEGQDYYRLVITPDAGTNDYEYHERLGRLGIKTLVIDHHILEEGKISKYAIIINNQTSPKYKNKNLSGAGVVHQFCRAIDTQENTNYSNKYWDLAAVGIIGDMMPVYEPENRFYISRGLHYPTENFFLNSMYEKQYYSIAKHNKQAWEPYDIELMNEKLKPEAISYYVSPLINAMIRYGGLEEKTKMFEAFVEGDKIIPSTKRGKEKGEPIPLAEDSIRECVNARSRQNKAKEKASEKLEIKIFNEGLLDNKILFVELDEDDIFPAELNGLIAMQLTAKHQRPTILARRGHDGFIKGSMRGMNGSELESLKDFLMGSSFFEWVQGHDNAAGVCIDFKKVEKFHKYANKALEKIDFGQGVYEVNFVRQGMDRDLSAMVKNLSYYERLWGQGMPEPLILIDNIPLDQVRIQVIGAKKDTLKFYYNDITYIKFRAEKEIKLLEEAQRKGSKLSVIGKPNLNEFNGIINAQIMIADFETEDVEFAF